MALFNEELIWLGRDNTIDLVLYSNASAVDLAAVTEMRLSLKNTTVIIASTSNTTGIIRWGSTSWGTGEIRIVAGGSTVLTPGRYTATLVVFDPSNSSGVVWDNNIPIRVMADPLAT
jgi:hypothetical protein